MAVAELRLERAEVDSITRAFGVSFDPGDFPSRIRSWLQIDALPYKVHTNRELSLMLAGTKPLAVFVGSYPPSLEGCEAPEGAFEPHVKAGRFVKREHIYSQPDPKGMERIKSESPLCATGSAMANRCLSASMQNRKQKRLE